MCECEISTSDLLYVLPLIFNSTFRSAIAEFFGGVILKVIVCSPYLFLIENGILEGDIFQLTSVRRFTRPLILELFAFNFT